jgi:hypothetical protein
MSMGVPPTTIRFLLEELCVELGFCLPPDAQHRLIAHPPLAIEEFTDAVIRAEGLDDQAIPRQLRREIRAIVTRYYGAEEL